jgi:hypothetical protein
MITHRNSFPGVLVERTVGEVIPAVTKNHMGIEEVIKKLSDQLATQERACEAFRTQHGIGGTGSGDEVTAIQVPGSRPSHARLRTSTSSPLLF